MAVSHVLLDARYTRPDHSAVIILGEQHIAASTYYYIVVLADVGQSPGCFFRRCKLYIASAFGLYAKCVVPKQTVVFLVNHSGVSVDGVTCVGDGVTCGVR